MWTVNGMLLFNSVSCRLKLTSIREMLSHSELYIKSNRLEESVLCVLCVTFKLVIALLSPVYLGSLKKKIFMFVSILGKIYGKRYENNTAEPFLCGCNTFWCPFNTHK